MLKARLAAALLLASVPAAAYAASSDWHHVQGGSVRVVTSGAPDADGLLRGALEIRLEPGWKTYWRDPGSSGVPPTLDVTVGGEEAAIEISFPAPQRFDDGYSLWAGYDEPVALALTFRLPAGVEAPARIAASAFLGVCETICIPVHTELTFDPYDDAGDPQHEAVVAAAFAALPAPAREGFGAWIRDIGGDALLVEATMPVGVEAVDLFVAGTDGITLGVPEKVESDNGTPLYSVPVLGGKVSTSDENVGYTLVTSAGAVTGTLSLR